MKKEKKEKKEKKNMTLNLKKYTNVVIYGLVVIIIAMILLIVFGTNKKVTCTMKSDQSRNGYVIETEHVIKARNGIVKSVTIKETISSSDSDQLATFEKDFVKQYEYNKKNYGGYTYKVTNDNKTVKTEILINYRKFDMEKFIKSNPAMKEYTNNKNKLTLKGAQKLYESTGAICK